MWIQGLQLTGSYYFFTVGGRLACIGGEGIIIIIIVRLFLTRRNTTKTLQGRAKA